MTLLKNKNLKLIAKGLVSLSLLAWLGSTVRWYEILAALAGIDPGWLLAAVVSIAASMVVSTAKWLLVLKAQQQSVGWYFLWRTYWEGLFLNNFLPSSIGGDALRIWRVSHYLNDAAGATASVVVERILAMAGIAITGILGALVLERTDKSILALFAVLLIITIVTTAAILSGIKPGGYGRVSTFLRQMTTYGQNIRKHRLALAGVLILSVMFQMLVVAVNYCLLRGLHVNAIGWWEACYLIPVTSVIAMIPASVNGFGIREGAYVGLMQGYQVSSTMAFTCSLLFAFLVSLCSLYGGVLLLRRGKGEPANVNRITGITNRQ